MLVLLILAACHTLDAPTPVTFGDAPAVGSADGTRLVFVGDTGSDTPERRALLRSLQAHCEAVPCDAIVLLGDLLYPRGPSSSVDPALDEHLGPFVALGPTLLVLGNHDYGHGRDHAAVAHLATWASEHAGAVLPGEAYSMPLGLGTLRVVDTNRVFQYGDEGQGAWLDAPWAGGWRIIAGHHPFRSNGPHGNAGNYEGWTGLPWVSGRSLEEFFEGHVCGHADFYLSGHEHNLQIIDHCGSTLVVSGSGAKVRPLVDRGNRPRFGAATVGFMELQLTDRTATVRAFDAGGALLHQHDVNAPERAP